MQRSHNIRIVGVGESVVCFYASDELYYLKITSPIPKIYDQDLNHIPCSNIDVWLGAISQQKCSYAMFIAMMEAFKDGVGSSYSTVEVRNIISDSILLTKDCIFHTEYLKLYSIFYWIEYLKPEKFEKLLLKAGDNVRHVIERHGEHAAINMLLRFIKYCRVHSIDGAEVFEQLLEELGGEEREPVYPDTTSLDKMLVRDVSREVSKRLKRSNNSIRSMSANIAKLE